VGEIVEFSCYLQLGKHGEKHRACGQKCINNGQPIGLVTADGSLYMLMEEEHDPRRDGATSDFRKAAAEHTAHVMEVTGTLAGSVIAAAFAGSPESISALARFSRVRTCEGIMVRARPSVATRFPVPPAWA